ncbi:uncharacterized protein [Amphiura filiformis]|uniref:uncharacterized protein isoform X2 n=1 Tax=Amphiura filiformis TaxID=82378 RepID=UPI003B22488E
MARYPPGGTLPPLQWSGDPPGRSSSRSSSRHDKHHNSSTPSRRSLKDDILASSGSLGAWQDKHAREMLQDHISTVNVAIKKLSAEIEAIETQLHSSERTSQYTSNNMKSLELQHVGSVNDLRSRVGRCDASIAKLSGDMRQLMESISFINQQLIQSNSVFTKATTDLQTQITKVETQMNKKVKDHESTQQTAQEESRQSVLQLNEDVKCQLTDLKNTVDDMQTSKEADVKRLQEQVMRQVDEVEKNWNQKQNDFMKDISNKIESIEKKVTDMETSFTNQMDLMTKSHQDLPARLDAKICEKLSASETSIGQQLEDSKKRSDHGLASLQESLETMRSVLEGKQKLLADDLRKEMSNMKKLVVLT